MDLSLGPPEVEYAGGLGFEDFFLLFAIRMSIFKFSIFIHFWLSFSITTTNFKFSKLHFLPPFSIINSFCKLNPPPFVSRFARV